MVAIDKYNRVRAWCKWTWRRRKNPYTGTIEQWYTLTDSFGADFGSIANGCRFLPVGRADGIVNYEWPMHWTESTIN